MNEVLENRSYYEMLLAQKEKGKIFCKEDLNYEKFYQLSVVENINDSMIGEIFGLNRNQVLYKRRKNNLSNVFLKK